MTHSHTTNFKTAFTIEELPDSQVKISGELPYVELESERKAALVSLGRDLELPGFRKGNIPTQILEKHIGEMRILTEMAERAISHVYPHILEEHNIKAIGYPVISITKIALQNPLGFTATVAVIPVVTLPDYAAIAKKVNADRPSDEVTDTEVAEKIRDILQQKSAYDRIQAKAANTKEATKKANEEEKSNELVIPELTDEVAMSLGQSGQFTSVDDLKAKLREHLEIEKKTNNTARHRATITDKILEETKVTLPKILIESEINQMFAQMKEDLDRANLKMDDYLVHVKKTKDDLATEWTPAASNRAKLQLILNEIALAEKITANNEDLERQTKELMEQFKDADEHRVRIYVASVLINDAVMKRLETI